MTAYGDALAGDASPRLEIGTSKPGSVAAAVALYFGSMTFSNLAPATQRNRRWTLEKFREEFGALSFATLRRDIVETMLAQKAAMGGQHAVKSFLKALRAVAAVAIVASLRSDDPTDGIRVKISDTGGFRTWDEGEIAQFEAAHPIGSMARLAFGLLLFTGQRRGDVIRMGRQHVRGGFLTVRQGKTGRALEIPLHAGSQEILAAHPVKHLTFLTTRAGDSTGHPLQAGSAIAPVMPVYREAWSHTDCGRPPVAGSRKLVVRRAKSPRFQAT
jgi:integrase